MENTNNTVSAQPMTDAQDIEKNKLFAVLAYFGILFLVPLFAAKDSKFAKFHANQGAIVFGIWLVLMFFWIFVAILPLPGIIDCLIWPLYFIPMILSILGIINALNGKMERLPVVGNYDLIK